MERFIPQDRRKFLKQMSVATLAAGTSLLESEHLNVQAAQSQQGEDPGNGSNQRAIEAARLRREQCLSALAELRHDEVLQPQWHADSIRYLDPLLAGIAQLAHSNVPIPAMTFQQ